MTRHVYDYEVYENEDRVIIEENEIMGQTFALMTTLDGSEWLCFNGELVENER